MLKVTTREMWYTFFTFVKPCRGVHPASHLYNVYYTLALACEPEFMCEELG